MSETHNISENAAQSNGDNSLTVALYSNHPQAIKSRSRREYLRTYQRSWMTKRRQAWIEQNGPCVVCGSSDRLEVDHINPEDKVLQPRALWSMSARNPLRIAELTKLQVLCYGCHKEKTKPFLRAKGLAQPSVNRTGYRGVTLEKSGRFRARVYNSGQKLTVGYFSTAQEAGQARAAALLPAENFHPRGCE